MPRITGRKCKANEALSFDKKNYVYSTSKCPSEWKRIKMDIDNLISNPNHTRRSSIKT